MYTADVPRPTQRSSALETSLMFRSWKSPRKTGSGFLAFQARHWPPGTLSGPMRLSGAPSRSAPSSRLPYQGHPTLEHATGESAQHPVAARLVGRRGSGGLRPQPCHCPSEALGRTLPPLGFDTRKYPWQPHGFSGRAAESQAE
eukprot:scaffold317_cov260-Pinguiococcus_pyrenoidosus.AAC.47